MAVFRLNHSVVVIQEWIDVAKELRRAVLDPKGRLLFA